MGKALAGAGHTIIVGSTNKTTADCYVLEGANHESNKRIEVLVIRPDDREPIPDSEQFQHLKFSSRRRGPNWTVSRAYQIKEADILIAIGGASKTVQAGHMAPALETPVLAVQAFDGSGKELWEVFRSDYERANLSAHDIGILEDPWSDESAEVITNCVKALVKANLYQDNGIPILVCLLVGVLIIMALWTVVFLNPTILPSTNSKQHSYATFLLLGHSAFLGAGLRTALPMLERRIVSMMQLTSEMIVGVFLAFGFMLVYLATGILVIGKVSVDVEGFRNAAVTTSLMAFTVAFCREGCE